MNAKRCAYCTMPTPVAWLTPDDACPWCEHPDPASLHECPTCGVAVLPDYGCPCSKGTRDRLDDAEYTVESEEADAAAKDDDEFLASF